jgi:hypothetical protein
LEGIANRALGVPRGQEVPRQLGGDQGPARLQRFEYLADPPVETSAHAARQPGVQRLLDQRVCKRVRIPAGAPRLLQQPSRQRCVQVVQHLRFGLSAGPRQHLQLDLLADHARQAQQLLRLGRQAAHAMGHY